MTEPLLTVNEVSGLVKLGPEAVRRAARRGELVGSKIGGRLRFTAESVDAWVAGTRVIPASPAPVASLPVVPSATNLDDLMRQHGLVA